MDLRGNWASACPALLQSPRRNQVAPGISCVAALGIVPYGDGASPINRPAQGIPDVRITAPGGRMSAGGVMTDSQQPGQAVRILLLEDDPTSVEIVGTYLRRIGFAEVTVDGAVTLSDALELLAKV